MATISESSASPAGRTEQAQPKTDASPGPAPVPVADQTHVLAIGNKLVPLSTLRALKVKVEPGQRYKVFKSKPQSEEIPSAVADNVIATRLGDDLHLRYADGSSVTLDGFYVVCTDASVCSVNLAGDTAAGYTISGNTASGAAVDGGTLVYAHGAHDILMGMAQDEVGMRGAFEALGNTPVLTYLPGSAAGVGASDKMGLTALLLGLGGVALAAGSGSGGSGSNGGKAIGTPGNTGGDALITIPESAITNVVQGQVSAGTVLATNNLTVTLLASDGVTEIGRGAVSETGRFSIQVGAYTGVVIARLNNTDAAADYLDEASRVGKDLNASLYAAGVIAGTNTVLQLNVTPLTTMAYRLMGVPPLTLERVHAANAAITTAFGVTDILQTEAITVTDAGFDRGDGLSDGEAIGVVLAALSGIDVANGGDSQATIDYLVTQLSLTDEQLSPAALLLLLEGARLAGLSTSLYGDLVQVHPRGMTLDLTPTQIKSLTPAQVASVPVVQVALLSQSQIAALTVQQTAALTSDQLGVLTAEQVGGITPAAIVGLTPAQVAVLTPAQVGGLTPAQVVVLTPAQVAVLTPAQVAAIAPAAVAALTPAQVAELSPAQVEALTPAQVAVVTPAQVAVLTPAQVAVLDPAQIAAISPAAITALTPAQVSALSSPQVGALLPAQVAVLTPAQIEALTPAQVAVLAVPSVAVLTPAQVTHLAPAQIAAMTPAQVGVLTPIQVVVLTPGQIAALTVEQVAAIVPAAVAALTPAQVSELSPGQVGALVPAQVGALTPAQVAAIAPAAVAALTPAQVAGLLPSQVGALAPAQVAVLTPAQVAVLDPAQIAAIAPVAVAALTPVQVAELSAAQVAALVPAQVVVLTPAQVAVLTPAQVAAITPQSVAALTPAQVAELSPAQIGAMTPAQVAVVTPAQVAVLTPAQVAVLDPAQIAAIAPVAVAALTPVQVAELSAAQVAALVPAQVVVLTPAQVAVLTPAQVAAITPQSVAALTPAQVAELSPAQIDALTPAQVAVVTPAQVAVLTPAQVAVLDPAQIAAIAPVAVAALTPVQVAELSTAQVAALVPAQVVVLTPAQVAVLTPVQVAAIAPAAVAVLTPAQVAELSPVQIDALTPAQVAVITPAQVAVLTPAQVAVLDPAQIAAISPVAVAALTPLQVAELSAAQVAALVPAQVVVLTPAQVAVLTPPQIAAIAPAAVAALTPAQVAELSPSQVGALAPAQVAVLAPAQVAVLEPAQIAAIAPVAVAALTPVQVAELSATQVAALLPAQVVVLTPAQVAVLTSAQVAAIAPAAVAALTPVQVAELSPAQIDALTPAQMAVITPAQIAVLTPAQVAVLDPAQIAAITPAAVAALTSVQVSELSGPQVAALIPAQVVALTPAQVAVLSAEQVAALAPAQVAVLTLAQVAVLDAEQIAAITPTSVAALSPTQVAHLAPVQVAAFVPAQVVALTPTQVAALAPAQVAAIAPAAIAALTAAQVMELSPDQVGALVPAQIVALIPAQVALISSEQVAALSSSQLTAFTPSQVASLATEAVIALSPIQIAEFTPQQIEALLPGQVSVLASAQVQALTPEQVAAFTPQQIAAIVPAAIAGLGAAQVAALEPDQIGALSPAQIVSFTPAAVAGMTSDQVAELTPLQVGAFSQLQIDALTPAQVDVLTPVQIAAIAPAAIVGFSAADVAGMSDLQLGALTPIQVAALAGDADFSALTASQIAALGTDITALTPVQLGALSSSQLDGLTRAQIEALSAQSPSGLGSLTPAQLRVVFDDTGVTPPVVQLAVDTGVAGDQITNTRGFTVTGLESQNANTNSSGLASWEWQLDGTSGAWTTGVGNAFVLPSNVADGSHTVYVRQADKAGFVSNTTSVAFTLDTTVVIPTAALAVDSGFSSADHITNTRTFAVGGLEPGANTTWEWQLDGTSGAWTAGSGTSLTLDAAVADGSHAVFVRQTDVAGNVSVPGTSAVVTLDTLSPTVSYRTTGTVLPAAPLVLDFSEEVLAGSGSIEIHRANDGSLVESLSVNDAARVSIDGNGVTIRPSSALTVGTAYYATVAATAFVDRAGNAYAGEAGTGWSFSASNLGTSVVLGGAGIDLSDGINQAELALNTLAISGLIFNAGGATGISISRVDFISDDGLSNFSVANGQLAAVNADIANGSLAWTLANDPAWASNLVSGKTYHVAVTLEATVNGASATGTSSSNAVLIDTIAPALTATVSAIQDNVGLIQGVVLNGASTDDANLLVTGSLSATIGGTDTVRIYDGSTYLGNATVIGNSWTFTDSRSLGDGTTVSYTARVADAAGNLAAPGASYAATIDTTAPAQTVVIAAALDDVGTRTGTVLNGGVTDDTQLSLAGTLSVGIATTDTVRVYDGTTYLGNATVSGTTWSFDDGRSLSDGASPRYTAVVADAAGNVGAVSSAYGVTIDTLPPTVTATVTAVNDDVGTAQGTIARGGLTDDTQLTVVGTLTASIAASDSVRIYDGSTYLGDAVINGANWSYEDSREISSGQVVSYTARVSDIAGNQSAATAPYEVTVDSGVPGQTASISTVVDNAGIVQGAIVNGGVTDDVNLNIVGTLSAAIPNTYTVRVSDGTTYLGDATVTTTGWTFADTRTLTDGQVVSYTAQVRSAAGVLSAASEAFRATVDITPPTPLAAITSVIDDEGIVQGTIANGGVTDDRHPTLNGTLNAAIDATDTVRVYDGSAYIGDATVAASGWSFVDSRTLSDGASLAYTVRVGDAAGNLGLASSVYATTLDIVAPAQTATVSVVADNVGRIQGTVASGGVTDDTQLVVSGTLSAAIGSTDTVRIYDGTTYLGNATVASTSWSFSDSRVLTDAAAPSYTARVADAAGNLGAASLAYAVTVDTTAPAQTAIIAAIVDDVGIVQGPVASGGVTDDTQPTITGTLSAGIAATDAVLIFDGTDLLGQAVVSANTWSFVDNRSLTDGRVLSYTARVSDAAGNLGIATTASTATVDITSPVATATISSIVDNAGAMQGPVANGGVTDDTQLDVTGTLSASIAPTDTVRVYDGAIYLGNALVNGTSWTYADGRTLANGAAVSYTARVSDAAGNQGAASAAYTAAVDTGAPTQTALVTKVSDDVGLVQGVVDSGGVTDDVQLTISGTLSAGLGASDTVRIYDGSTYLGDAVASGSTWGFVDSRMLTDGQTVSYRAQVANAAGTLGANTTSYTLSVDTTAPTKAPSVSSVVDDIGIVQGTVANGGVTDDTQLVINGALSAALGTGDSVRVYDGAAYLGNATVSANGWTYVDSRVLGNGTAVSYTARLMDAAGNLGAPSSAYAATIDTVIPTGTATVTAIRDDVGAIQGVVSSGGVTDDTQLDVSGILSGSLGSGETVRIYDGASYLGNAVVSGTSWSYADSRVLLDGVEVRYTAQVSDAAGNQSAAAAAYTATVESGAPTQTALVTAITDDIGPVQGTVPNGGSTDDAQLTISGTLTAVIPNAYTVRIYDGASYLGNATVVDATWSYVDGRTLVDGQALSYTAYVSNAAGSLSAATAAYAATVDTTPPTQTTNIASVVDDVGIQVGTVANGGVTDDTQLTLSGTLSVTTDGSDRLRIYDGATYLGDAVVTGTSWTYADTRTLADGQGVSYSARVVDGAGNQGAASSVYRVTVDTAVPQNTATVTLINDDVGIVQGPVTNGGTTDDTQLTIGGTLSSALGAAETVRIYDGTTYLGDAAVSGNSWTYVDGRGLDDTVQVSYTARVADQAGNMSAAAAAFTATIDLSAPSLTASVAAFNDDVGIVQGSVPSGGVTDDTQPTISGELSAGLAAGDTVRVYDGASYLGNAVISGNGWTYSDVRTLVDGAALNYTARVSDAAGNIGAGGTIYAVSVDTAAPSQTAAIAAITDNVGRVQGTVANGGRTDDTQLALSGTLSASIGITDTVRVYDTGVFLGIASVSGSTWTYADSRTLADNQALNYTVRISDAAGNQTAASAVYAATIDVTAPTQTVTLSSIVDNVGVTQGPVANGGSTDDTQLSIAGTLSVGLASNDTVRVYDGSTYLGDAVVSGSSWTYVDSRVLADNQTVSYTAHVSDVAGNDGANSAVYTATVQTELPAVSNAAAIDAITNLDVRSNIVLNFGEAVTVHNGGFVSLVNTSNSGTKVGFGGESVNHTLNFYIGTSTIAGGVTTAQTFQDSALTIASGTLTISAAGVVTLDPRFDLDLSNNYHIDIAANTFVSSANGAGNAAYSGMNFETVTPGSYGSGGLGGAAASVTLNATGTATASNAWLDVEALGSFSTATQVDAGALNYAFVVKNVATPNIQDTGTPDDPVDSTKGELATASSNVRFSNFTMDGSDILYFDTQANDGVDRDFFYYNSYAASSEARFNLAPSSASEGGQSWYAFTGFTADDPRIPSSVIAA